MAKRKPGKSRVKKSAAKKEAAESKPAPSAPQVWRCKVGWVRYRSARYECGDTILVIPETMTPAELLVLKRYFELMPTGIMTGVSEPVEPLDEGEDHGDHSN